ncbi:hypothetical protein BX666DRAFT_555477 [Dichotomocladium elegans]|nr:hypothetical protein BX666DRAFT_555477 [Dichotomocladium elegans]
MPQHPPMPPDTPSAAEDEDEDEEQEQEESSDGGSVTRCLCGEKHNVGLMVQCDKCEVWQHCDCVGLTENEMPELYYCDHCQPDNHIVYKSHGRYKRAYDPNGNRKDNVISQVTTQDGHCYHRTAKRRKRQEDTTEDETMEEDEGSQISLQQSQPRQQHQEHQEHVQQPQQQAPPSLPQQPPLPITVAAATIAVTAVASPPPPTTPKQTKPSNRRSGPTPQHQERRSNGNKKGSPRPSTPDDLPSIQSYWDHDGLPTREGSPPAKIKYPSPKMTIADMNKRAKQILEYVNKLQLDFAGKRRERSNSTSSASSSLSSASTLPLIEDGNHDTNKCSSPTTPIPAIHPESAIEMMDRITHDLVQFQRKFGSRR